MVFLGVETVSKLAENDSTDWRIQKEQRGPEGGSMLSEIRPLYLGKPLINADRHHEI